MSYCRKEGKDVIIFATEDDHKEPSKIKLPEPEPSPGLILPDGSINWNCPCLGGMATGPCGVQFREAFSCFHYSKEEPKGSECFDSFREMQTCMAQYPTLYNNPDDEDDEDFADFNSTSEKSELGSVNKLSESSISAESDIKKEQEESSKNVNK